MHYRATKRGRENSCLFFYFVFILKTTLTKSFVRRGCCLGPLRCPPPRPWPLPPAVGIGVAFAPFSISWENRARISPTGTQATKHLSFPLMALTISSYKKNNKQSPKTTNGGECAVPFTSPQQLKATRRIIRHTLRPTEYFQTDLS